MFGLAIWILAALVATPSLCEGKGRHRSEESSESQHPSDAQDETKPDGHEVHVESAKPVAPPTRPRPPPPAIMWEHCRPGWTAFRDACYQYNADILSRDEAKFICAGKNSYLTTILSKDEDDFLKKLAPEGGAFWTGLKLAGEAWKWESGATLDGYTNWLPGNPDGPMENGISCVRANVRDGRWDDYFCRRAASMTGFICKYERAAVNEHLFKQPHLASDRPMISTKIHESCKIGWTEFNDGCYQYSADSLTREQAKTKCAENDGYLTTILTMAEENFLKTLVTRPRASFWTGLKRRGGVWRWEDNSVLGRYSNWAPTSPDGPLIEGVTCMHPNFMERWDDTPCNFSSKNIGYICKYDMITKQSRKAFSRNPSNA